MQADQYIRKATLVRVIDGDTVELDIDLGFHLTRRERVRILGINCPEIKGPTRPASETATMYAINWFERHGHDVTVRTLRDKSDSFGRYLAEITGLAESGLVSLGMDLILSGNAIPYRANTGNEIR